MALHTLKALRSIETPVTTCSVAWHNIAEDCHDKLKSHYSLTVLAQIFPWFISELQTVSDRVICCTVLWRIFNLNGENLREKNVIDTRVHRRLVYCYTVDVGTITKHGCPECVPFAVLNPNSYTEFWNWVVKILLHIQQALALVLSTHAVTLTDCNASLPVLLFKYRDIILTQTTAASASHFILHRHTLNLGNAVCAVNKML